MQGSSGHADIKNRLVDAEAWGFRGGEVGRMERDGWREFRICLRKEHTEMPKRTNGVKFWPQITEIKPLTP